MGTDCSCGGGEGSPFNIMQDWADSDSELSDTDWREKEEIGCECG